MNRYFRELERRLIHLGMTVDVIDDGLKYADILKDGQKVVALQSNGEIQAYPDQQSLMDKVTAISKEINEYITAYEEAEELQVEGLRGNYKKLLEYNRNVFAMKEFTKDGYEFVTWERTDDNGLTWGHYYSDYTMAKNDFAIRSGLIDTKKLFTETELTIIYSNLIKYLQVDSEVPFETKKGIGEVLNKIEDLVMELLTTKCVDREVIEEELELER